MRQGHEKPVNAVAGRVVSHGESFDYKTHDWHKDSNMPLPIRKPTKQMLHMPAFIDLTATKFGRLTVLGLSATEKARWVCKCAYGIYTLRTAHAIKIRAPDAACMQCYLLAVSKRKDYERRTGKTAETKSFF